MVTRFRFCEIEECGRVCSSKKFCDLHYKRFQAHGDPLKTLLPRLDKSQPCSVDGCGSPVRKKGMCNSHYTKDWRERNPEKATRAKRSAWERRSSRKRVAELVSSHSLEEWEALLERCDYKCFYCGGLANSRDHIIPLIKGGSDDISNIVPACLRCNKRKGAMDLVDFLEKIKSNERET